jgi:hypothetical protein
MNLRSVRAIAILIVFVCATESRPAFPQTAINPVTQQVQGNVYILGDSAQAETAVKQGAAVGPYKTISTDSGGKVMIEWGPGLSSSAGEVSSFFYTSEQDGSLRIDLMEGIFRTSQGTTLGESGTPFSVVTPMASIGPALAGEPSDFVVEVYDSSSTIVSVLSGRIKVKNVDTGEEKVVESCQSVFISQGKQGFDPAPISSEVMNQLVSASTIGDSMPVAGSYCPPPAPAYAGTPPPETLSAYPGPDYVEEPDLFDSYPWDQVQVIPPPYPGADYLAVLPGIGTWYIPMPVDYAYPESPTIIQNYIEQTIIQQNINIYRVIFSNIRIRANHINNLIVLGRRTGNRALLARATDQLRDLRTNRQLTRQRLAGLERRAGLINDRISGHDNRIAGVINDSLRSSRNSAVAQNLNRRLTNAATVNNGLAKLASNELGQIQKQLGRQKDPAQRLALRSRLDDVNKSMAQGKVPITKADVQVANAVNQLSKTRDPHQLAEIQDRLAKQLGPPASQMDQEAVSGEQIQQLRNSLSKTENKPQRQELTNRLSELENAPKAPLDLKNSLAGIIPPAAGLTMRNYGQAPGLERSFGPDLQRRQEINAQRLHEAEKRNLGSVPQSLTAPFSQAPGSVGSWDRRQTVARDLQKRGLLRGNIPRDSAGLLQKQAPQYNDYLRRFQGQLQQNPQLGSQQLQSGRLKQAEALGNRQMETSRNALKLQQQQALQKQAQQHALQQNRTLQGQAQQNVLKQQMQAQQHALKQQQIQGRQNALKQQAQAQQHALRQQQAQAQQNALKQRQIQAQQLAQRQATVRQQHTQAPKAAPATPQSLLEQLKKKKR